MDESIISIQNLTKRYGDFTAVNRISFQVNEGDFFGFLGPNGAGKTTTVKMLTGLTSISSGTVHIFSYNILKYHKKIKSQIGVVEDVANLFPDLTVYENLLFKSIIFGIEFKKIKNKIYEYLEQFNLIAKLKSKFLSLSRGQKRIVSIISSLIYEPRILFLDEPTLGLDINARNKIHTLLENFNKNKITIFLTSHYLEEVQKLCDRIAVIKNGRIIFDGNMKKLKSLFPGEKVLVIEFDKYVKEKDITVFFKHFKIKKNKLFISYNDISLILHQLEKYIARNHLKVIDINTEGNNLEDLFLRMVG